MGEIRMYIRSAQLRLSGMKLLKGMLLVAALLLCLGVNPTGVAAEEAVVTEQAEEINLDAGLLIDGSVLVPLRDITELLQAELTWDAHLRKITLEKGEQSVILTIDNPEVMINGTVKTLTAPRIEYDKTFVPLRLISEAFGAAVEWDGANQLATIRGEGITVYVGSYPYFDWQGTRFVYVGELSNGKPHGEGIAVKGTTIYSDTWYEGPWENGQPVQLASHALGVYLNGQYVALGKEPFIQNDALFVPLAAMLRALDLDHQVVEGVMQINHPNRVLLIGKNNNLLVYLDSAYKSTKTRLNNKTISIDDTLFAPMSLFTDYLSVKVAGRDGNRIDLTAEKLGKNTWVDNKKVTSSATALMNDILVENNMEKYGDSLWSKNNLPYPGKERFNQYEKLTVVSYSGLNLTLSNGKVTIPFKFQSFDELNRSLYVKDPLAEYNWPESTKQLIRERSIKKGMTQEQVWMAYGYAPTRKTNTSMFEMWTYPHGNQSRYLYFTDGKLTNWVEF